MGGRPTRAVMLLVLLAPVALAGTESSPEIVDARGDLLSTPADIIAAWFEHDALGLRFTIKTVDGGMPERYTGYVYFVVFRTGGVLSSAMVGFGSDGRYYGHVGPLSGPEYDRGGLETFANGRVTGLDPDPGRPSTWSGLLPWGAVPGLHDGATLIDLAVGSARFDPQAREWKGGLDTASTTKAFVVAPVPSVLDAPVVQTALLAGTTLAGAVGGLVVLRRRPTLAPKALPTPLAPETPREPHRIRVDPRE